MRYLPILMLLAGCTVVPTLPDFPDASIEDAHTIDVGIPALCTSRTNYLTDFNNCSECGNACSPQDADRCVNGFCQCGIYTSCLAGSDCRAGACVIADPTGYICEFDADCVRGNACIEGRCTFVSCVPEVCDGYDNDCDGRIDNVAAIPLSGFCIGTEDYTSLSATSPCVVGVRVCTEGRWGECLGDVPPVAEAGFLACDGIDNNCDSCIDGDLDPTTMVCSSNAQALFDVVFVIDVSGSMSGVIDIVTQAVSTFAGRLASTDVKYALVEIPGVVDGTVEVTQDLNDLTTLQGSLDAITTHGGLEPQVDAVYLLGTGDLELSWSEGAVRIIIVFTDEPAQSAMVPPLTEADMCGALTNGEALVIVAPPATQMYLGAPPGIACAFGTMELPVGSPGSGDPCSVDTECPGTVEICFSSACVTETVRDTVLNLETVIVDPCG